jgi:hypothetical protein
MWLCESAAVALLYQWRSRREMKAKLAWPLLKVCACGCAAGPQPLLKAVWLQLGCNIMLEKAGLHLKMALCCTLWLSCDWPVVQFEEA